MYIKTYDRVYKNSEKFFMNKHQKIRSSSVNKLKCRSSSVNNLKCRGSNVTNSSVGAQMFELKCFGSNVTISSGLAQMSQSQVYKAQKSIILSGNCSSGFAHVSRRRDF